ncbi:MAG: helix-turn-helix transcriptional regulator [Pseudomonadota bacterium]
MSSQFALDLRLARKKAGFTQDDLAHLLAAHQTVVSHLELGKRRPSLTEIIDLSLIYGRSFEDLFAEVMEERKEHLSVRLASLPSPGRKAMSTFNRPRSLARLKRRLTKEETHGRA